MSMEWIDYIITKNGTYVGADEAEANIATLQAKMHSMQCCYLESLNQERALSITQLEAAHATIATLRSAIAASETIHHGDILHLKKLINEAEADSAKLRDVIEQWRDTFSDVVRERNKRFPVDEVKAWMHDWLCTKNGIENKALEDAIRYIDDDQAGLAACRNRQKPEDGSKGPQK